MSTLLYNPAPEHDRVAVVESDHALHPRHGLGLVEGRRRRVVERQQDNVVPGETPRGALGSAIGSPVTVNYR